MGIRYMYSTILLLIIVLQTIEHTPRSIIGSFSLGLSSLLLLSFIHQQSTHNHSNSTKSQSSSVNNSHQTPLMAKTTSSEYLIETLPGWQVEDFLDSSSVPFSFSKGILGSGFLKHHPFYVLHEWNRHIENRETKEATNIKGSNRSRSS